MRVRVRARGALVSSASVQGKRNGGRECVAGSAVGLRQMFALGLAPPAGGSVTFPLWWTVGGGKRARHWLLWRAQSRLWGPVAGCLSLGRGCRGECAPMGGNPESDGFEPAFSGRLAEHVRRGEFERAREILGSRIAQVGFQPDELERLGWVLLAMGDHIEAGRYLFLSGRRRDEYRDSIAAFLSRCWRANLSQFISQWPASIRRTRLDALPPPVLESLTARGMTPQAAGTTLEDLRRHAAPAKTTNPSIYWLAVLAVACSLLYFLNR